MGMSADIIAGVNDMVARMGETCNVKDKNNVVVTAKMVVLPVAKDNEQLVNSIGIAGATFYMKSSSTPPKKFDVITVPSTGFSYTVIEEPTAPSLEGAITHYEILGKQ